MWGLTFRLEARPWLPVPVSLRSLFSTHNIPPSTSTYSPTARPQRSSKAIQGHPRRRRRHTARCRCRSRALVRKNNKATSPRGAQSGLQSGIKTAPRVPPLSLSSTTPLPPSHSGLEVGACTSTRWVLDSSSRPSMHAHSRNSLATSQAV